MTDRRDELLQRDWSEVWDDLPEAPPLVPASTTFRGQQEKLRHETGRLVEAVLTALGIPRFASWRNARLGGQTPKDTG